MKRVGFYGGAFNPPHIGHINGAKYAMDALELTKLYLIPTSESPHKILPPDSPTPAQRLEMLDAALEGVEGLAVSDIEIARGGVSYTYETVQKLQEEFPDCERILLMGTDMFLSFLSWRYPERILKSVCLAVLCRGDADEDQKIHSQKKLLEQKGATVYVLENPVYHISSSDLRRMLTFRCTQELIPQNVLEYIRRHGLYAAERSYKNLPEDALQQTVTHLLKPERVAHVLGCRDTARELARLWGADPDAAARAGLLHDITKALPGDLQIELCRAYGVELDDFSRENPKTLHALTGSLVAERIFAESAEVVSAIRWHTTGKENMSVLEKIIYVADYMEPNRSFPGVQQLRQQAYEDLDGALKLGLTMTLDTLKKQGRTISRESMSALEYLNQNGV